MKRKPLLRKIGIVLACIGAGLIGLATLGVKVLGDTIEKTRIVRAQGDLEGLKAALVSYDIAVHQLPATEQGLQALVTKPEGVSRWVMVAEPAQLVDPWNHDYHYVLPGVHNPDSYDLFSAGPDGQPNTADDIGNWNPSAM